MSKVMRKSSQKLPVAMTLVDRISNLPDSLLCHMLSFLETKQAVATSILSKRWEFLWTYVDILDFDDYFIFHPTNEYPPKMQFAQFVHRVMHLHRAPLIKRLRLHCEGRGCNEHDVVTWIRIVVSRKVESLDLHLTFDLKWPLCLFYSQTLTELKLAFGEFAYISNMNIPTAPFFPTLKNLHLEHLKFTTDSLTRFICGCPILEYLYLEYKDDSMEECYTSSATLKTFRFFCRTTSYHQKPKIVLNTPALDFLEIWDCGNSLLSVESSMPFLHEAHITFDLCEFDEDSNSDTSLSYLESLSNVEVLSVEVNYLIWTFDLNVHFYNLTTLEITAPLFGLDLLRILMEKSNNLKVITLEKTTDCNVSRSTWEEPQHVPKCLLSSLQTLCINGYKNEEDVELMIKYVMGNAKVLNSMEIHTLDCVKNDDEFKSRMLQRISKFPKVSKICEITISNREEGLDEFSEDLESGED